ncbi:hypothetical protein M9H77_24974 [Catharanthus roseus]|uniref:Uncharacterized protein n=1 Tax=Catharanthus roseus TaxID=4058 RepID=A0ACC0A6G6_CATRO|nr:hypothetical protein M9H77_24974 [Catharanthus roseus]
MEVMIPVHNMQDFDFNNSRSNSSSNLFMSAPSTPKGFGENYYFMSAPSSPSRISKFYQDFEDFLMINGCLEPDDENDDDGDDDDDDDDENSGSVVASVPFAWEEKPGKPKSPKRATAAKEDEFAFDVSEDFEKSSVSAEELFDGGVIKPLKPPPRLQLPAKIRDSAQNQISPGSFSPRHEKLESNSSSRGRERTINGNKSSSNRRVTRSLSPLRVSEYQWDEEQELEQQEQQEEEEGQEPKSQNDTCSALSLSSSGKSFMKWSFKDLFLFRSASEGRAADKDPFRKYRALRRFESNTSSSSRAIIENGGGSVGSMSRRRGPISAHELHYTMNRAVSEDMKKKTFLPYKQGILGRLAFNPAAHALSNGFGFSHH